MQPGNQGTESPVLGQAEIHIVNAHSILFIAFQPFGPATPGEFIAGSRSVARIYIVFAYFMEFSKSV
jgi:hypothetical protein